MLPSELRVDDFRGYPPQAQALIIAHLPLLRQLPTVYVASLLREAIDYDWKFPAERSLLDGQLAYLTSLSKDQVTALFAGFTGIRLDRKLEDMDWQKQPAIFSERLTAWLWSTHQIDAFRRAATEFGSKVAAATPPEPPLPVARLGIAVVGQGVQRCQIPLFRKLRPHGVHFTNVDPAGGLQILTEAVAERSARHPLPYGHWYIDGSTANTVDPQVTAVAYEALRPVRTKLLEKMQQVIRSGEGGPELLEVVMTKLTPEELGMQPGILDRFQVNVLTQGSGTQIFSTTFVQWTAREALRRAQPVTLLSRFTPRQRQRPMNELLDSSQPAEQLDPQGSLVDADMGSYYIWLDQQRLPHAEDASFLVWFEDHNEALAVGPGLPRGTASSNPANLQQILKWIS